MTVVGSTRTRFRRATAILAAFGVLVVGLVPVTAAYAAETVTVTMTSQGNPVQTNTIFLVNDKDVVGSAIDFDYSDASGQVDFSLEPGEYDIYTSEGSRYETTRFSFTVDDSGPQSFAFDVDTRPMVTGSVSPGLAPYVGVNTYRWQDSYWSLVSGSPWLTDSSGNFEIWFSDADGQWALEFIPGDSDPYMTTYLGGDSHLPYDLSDSSTYFELDGPNTSVDVGTTTLIDAGIVTGTVTGYDSGPIDDAYVIADDLDENELAETRTNASGAYTLKVPLDVEFTVRSYADGWLHQFFDGEYDLDDADPIELSSIDLTRSDVDFVLDPAVEAHFDIYVDDGGTPEPFAANTWLYYNAGSGFGPIPFSVEWNDDSPGFWDLPPGTYRVGLQLVDESGWIPFSTANVTPGTIPAAASACYFEFEVTGDIVEFEFELTADPASSVCTEAPWIDGAGTPVMVSGVVTNIADVVGPATARLYLFDFYAGVFEVVSTTVDPVSGEYSLPGVYFDGEYFVGIQTARNNPHLDMFFGDGAETLLFYRYDEAFDGYFLDAQEDLEDVDVTLPPARVLSGIVTANGTPVEGACVALIESDSEDEVDCQPTDSEGRYFVKAPVPLAPPPAFRYKIYTEGFASDIFWGVDPTVGDEIPVSIAGIDPFSYDIDIDFLPTVIFGTVSELDDSDNWQSVDNGKAHLYRKTGANWVEVESVTMLEDGSQTAFAFPSELMEVLEGGSDDLFGGESLDPGDYRIWFSQNGNWLPITEYLKVVFSASGAVSPDEFEGVVCYLDVSGTTVNSATMYLGVLVDPSLTTNCAPPPPPTPTPTPGGGSTPQQGSPGAGGNGGSDDAPDEVVDDGETGGESPGTAVPTTPTPSPSATPAPSADDDSDSGGVDLSWLWWTGGILLLLVLGGGTILVLRRP